jgi:hypothetical protein
MISTRDLSGLSDVDGLKRLLQSMAMLDAILSPEWEFRYYSFNSKWSRGKQMGSMRNGSGDDFFALFNRHGCFLKGFAHEYEMTPYRVTPKRVWPGVLDSVPPEFADGLNEPAFSMGDTTFCIWRRYTDPRWQRGKIKFPTTQPDPDGSEFLLSPLDGKPETYHNWATDYFGEGVHLTLDAVRYVYAHKPLTEELVTSINPDLTLSDLAADIDEIGYPRRARKN